MTIEQIFRSNVMDRGFPFTGQSGESRYRFNERIAYDEAKAVLAKRELPAAWVLASIFQGRTSMWLIEGDYTRYYEDPTDGQLTSCGPVKLERPSDGLGDGLFACPRSESRHGFVLQHANLPVVFPDGKLGQMEYLENGYVKISRNITIEDIDELCKTADWEQTEKSNSQTSIFCSYEPSDHSMFVEERSYNEHGTCYDSGAFTRVKLPAYLSVPWSGGWQVFDSNPDIKPYLVTFTDSSSLVIRAESIADAAHQAQGWDYDRIEE